LCNKFGVSRETLRQRIAGRRTCKEANDDMSWFTLEEDQVLIGFLKEMAEHGFPDMKRYLREGVCQCPSKGKEGRSDLLCWYQLG